MGENKRTVDLKKHKLKEELEKEEPNKNKINRLKDSITRHKKIDKQIKYMSNKRKYRKEKIHFLNENLIKLLII